MIKLYTIGHSNHPADNFIYKLASNGIAVLADVRTTPSSRFNPQFNKGNLQKALAGKGIEYIYMGKDLGGRPTDPSCYLHQAIPKSSKSYLDEIDYTEVMQRPWFIQGIESLLEVAGKHPTCIMCSEGDPAQCHRHHLIAAYLTSYAPEVNVIHILRDGSLVDVQSIRVIGDDTDAEMPAF